MTPDTASKTLRRLVKRAVARVYYSGANLLDGRRAADSPPRFLIGSYHHFEGNALAFTRHCAGRPEVEIVAVCRDAKDLKHLAQIGVRTVAFGSAAEIAAMAHADFVFTVGHLHTDYSVPRGRARWVHLYHGMPLKAVGHLARPTPDPMGAMDFAIATSPFTETLVRGSLAAPTTTIWVTGEPKTDPLIAGAPVVQHRPWLPRPAVRRLISYLPTWRHDFSRVTGGDYAAAPEVIERVVAQLQGDVRLAAVLERHDAALVVKSHPWAANAGTGPAPAGRVLVLDPRAVGTEELMQASDVMLSDYSAALVDWLALRRPTVAFAFDLDEYWSHRGSPLVDYRGLFGKIMVGDPAALADRLEAILSAPPGDDPEIARLNHLFHARPDGQGSARIVEQCLRVWRQEEKQSG